MSTKHPWRKPAQMLAFSFRPALILSFIFSLLMLPGAPASAGPAAPAADSPACGSDPSQVGCWLFSEGTGTTAADGSGNGNTGTLVGNDGTMWVADRFGNPAKALHFNGTSQHVQVADSNSLDITGDITISAWVKPEVINTQDVVKKAVTTGTTVNGYELDLSIDTGTTCAPGTNPCAFARFNQASSADNYRINSMSTYSASDPWTLYVVTYTGVDNTLRIYRNGTLSNSRVVAGLTIAANTLYLGFGAQLAGAGPTASRWFRGSLDDIRLYKRALSAAEIKALYNDMVPNGFTCTALQSQAGTANTEWKPMSKVWYYQNKWWSVFPASSGVSPAGAWLWRLDGTAWTPVLNLSTNTSAKADVKPAGSPVGSVVHILLYYGTSSDLASVQYNAGAYQLWTTRPGLTAQALPGSETATIDIDSTGRMWLNSQRDVASPAGRDILVYYSDSPYSAWSGPVTLATGTVQGDDISLVTALPNNTIGVLWSNQTTRRFGFKYHVDGSAAATWSGDEVPASQSANDGVGAGMADDHLNVAVASDGTLYAAVKTGWDTAGYPRMAMLVRRLSGASGAGVWDNLYGVSESGTRPIVVLDDTAGVINFFYSSVEGGGNIIYRQTAVQPISFGSVLTMRSGTNNDVSSTRQNINGELVAIYSNGTTINGSLCTAIPSGGIDLAVTKTDNKSAALPGEASTYTIVVTNPGASAVTGVTVTDTMPVVLTGVTWTCSASSGSSCTASGSGNLSDTVTLAATGSVTYTVSATISPAATGAVVNTATITPPPEVTDPNPANNSATDVTALRETGLCGSDANLVACYQFDEGAGTVVLDGALNTVYNDGSVVGTARWTSSGRFGTALEMDGTNDYVLASNEASLNISSQITLVAWIRPGRSATQRIVSKSNMGTTGVNGYELSLSSATKVFVRFNQTTSGDLYRVNSTTSYPTNGTTWMHVAATFDGSTIRLYVNGVQEGGNVAMPVPIVTNTLGLAIGSEPPGTSNPYRFQGAVDDVRIYNRALSAAEIQALYVLPTAVSVSSFNGKAKQHAIQLEWETGNELELLGFNLFRSETLDGPRQKQNAALIQAANRGQLLGTAYQFSDPVSPGRRYYYWLELVGVDGAEITGPVIVNSDYLIHIPIIVH